MRTDIGQTSQRGARLQRMEAAKLTVIAYVSSVLLCGCSSSVQRGADFYMQRRYIDAAQVFEHCESQLPDWEEEERAEYALYRGATFLALGSTDDARRWLRGAQRGARHLSASDRALLRHSLHAVNADTQPALLESASGLAATPAPFRP